MNQERDYCIDVAKGVGIILVVFGHIHDFGFCDLGIARSAVYLFHVPLFFFLSGIFYKQSESFIGIIKKKGLRLYLPFILANLLYFGLEVIIGKRYGWDDLLKILIGLKTVDSAFPSWFLVVLFRVFVVYKLMCIATKGNNATLTITACLLGVIGTFVPGVYWLGQTLVALLFFHFGRMSKQIIGYLRSAQPIIKIPLMIIMVLSLCLIANKNGDVSFAWGMYGNRPLSFMGSLIGICITLILSDLMACVPITRNVLSAVGRETLPILLLHFLFVWTAVQVRSCLSIDGMPVLWVMICLVSGVVGPYIVAIVYSKVLSRIKH